MNEEFVRQIYQTVVKEDLQIYKELLETAEISRKTDVYWKEVIKFYRSLDVEEKQIILNIIEHTIIDTTSMLFGVIDGSTLLTGEAYELELKINGIDTENELQDIFLSFIEQIND